MNIITIVIARDFTDTPGGRYKNEGEFSGEEFRNCLLRPKYEEAVRENKELFIDLDGCMGYPSSFLDESFGGLAREYPGKDISKRIILKSDDQPGLVNEIMNMIKKG